MQDELEDRQRAIQLRLMGESIPSICRVLRRSRNWFHRWWHRYTCPTSRASAGRAKGPDGLFELAHINHYPRGLAPEVERTILAIRQQIESQTHPGTRYGLIGAQSIVAELEALHIRPVPSLRTVERVLQRHGVTLPRIRLAPLVSRYTCPTPPALDSNQVHQVDCIGHILPQP
jgi:putative transposase